MHPEADPCPLAVNAPSRRGRIDPATVDPTTKMTGQPRQMRAAIRIARGRLIHSMIDRGATVSEVAAALAIDTFSVFRMARAMGLRVGAQGSSSVRAWLPNGVMSTLRSRAEHAGVDPQELARRLLIRLLTDDASVAVLVAPDILSKPRPVNATRPRPEKGPSKRALSRVVSVQRREREHAERAAEKTREIAAIAALRARRVA